MKTILGDFSKDINELEQDDFVMPDDNEFE